MECKCIYNKGEMYWMVKELIDTLWNVNVYLAGEAGTGKKN